MPARRSSARFHPKQIYRLLARGLPAHRVGGEYGNARRVDASRDVTVVATGFAAELGVAYDAANHRLFVANHVGTPGQNTLEIRPVP